MSLHIMERFNAVRHTAHTLFTLWRGPSGAEVLVQMLKDALTEQTREVSRIVNGARNETAKEQADQLVMIQALARELAAVSAGIGGLAIQLADVVKEQAERNNDSAE